MHARTFLFLFFNLFFIKCDSFTQSKLSCFTVIGLSLPTSLCVLQQILIAFWLKISNLLMCWIALSVDEAYLTRGNLAILIDSFSWYGTVSFVYNLAWPACYKQLGLFFFLNPFRIAAIIGFVLSIYWAHYLGHSDGQSVFGFSCSPVSFS